MKIGEHNGAHFYTIGQRKGLGVGGKVEPLFVVGTDVVENIIFVGMGDGHLGLNRKGLFIKSDEIHWVRPDLRQNVGEEKRYKIRIRYRQPLQDATLRVEADGAYITFDNLQRGITAGQFAAWYSEDEELIGSGVIDK